MPEIDKEQLTPEIQEKYTVENNTFLATPKRIWWFILGRCKFCGGSVWEYDDRRFFCNQCDKKQ